MEAFRLGFTYDDVLLEPRHSSVRSRRSLDISTLFTKNFRLTIPIVGANMDTVTQAEMCVALAELGGIGVLHRFMTPMQVEEVRRVKRRQSLIIEEAVHHRRRSECCGGEGDVGQAEGQRPPRDWPGQQAWGDQHPTGHSRRR